MLTQWIKLFDSTQKSWVKTKQFTSHICPLYPFLEPKFYPKKIKKKYTLFRKKYDTNKILNLVYGTILLAFM